ncbi:ABC transporter ATP-binding protein [Sporosarcina sp. OR05]|uniref:ABC transporter ATP-binding protein n=1 Tax=Sporosarcina sp. OR05 TaxID=2969819 RepID=UPI003529F9B7
MTQPLFEMIDVDVAFHLEDGSYKALDGISFEIEPNEIVGIVGESGCGKSLTSLTMMNLLHRTSERTAGTMRLKGKVLDEQTDWHQIRGNEMAMIFQEPMTALNPLMTIGKQMTESLKQHTNLSKIERQEKAYAVMREVGLSRVETLYRSYPHELSGGMRQRVVIAMALINEPDLIIADEPTTALDVTIQAQILHVFKSVMTKRQSSLVFISHDLGVIKEICDRVIVMYAGRIIETGTVEDVFSQPKHPYTKGLLQAIPTYSKRGTPLYTIPGTVPPLQDRKNGCLFVDRCGERMPQCIVDRPFTTGEHGHYASCHLMYEEDGVNAVDSTRKCPQNI